MDTFTFPSSAELREIEQDKLPVLTQDDPLFEFFPIVEEDAEVIQWEQKDNYTGLQQLRGPNGEPHYVKRVGSKRYQMLPGTYGEFAVIDEVELTRRRKLGTFAEPVDITDLVMSAQDQLLDRRINRVRHIIWTLITTGTFAVAMPDGTVGHKDSFDLQKATVAVDWSDLANAKPLADLRALQLLARGHSVRFDSSARAYANLKTVHNLLNNNNPNDLGGKRIANGSTVNSLQEINAILAANDLPQFVPYDEGYLDDSGAFVPFVGDDTVAVIGRRVNGQKLGEYQMTRNAQNPDLAPGAYTRVIDTREHKVSGNILEVHDGHNGGPVIFFPSAVIILDTKP